MALEVLDVWQKLTPALEAEILQFWLDNKALVEKMQPAKRVQQVVCLARSEEGGIVGVSTAQPYLVPMLGQPMYQYRNFIAAGARGQQLSIAFLLKAKAVLQAYNQALATPQCLGIILELGNEALAQRQDQAHWPRTGFTFIGYTPKGLHLRVWYFAGARLFDR